MPYPVCINFSVAPIRLCPRNSEAPDCTLETPMTMGGESTGSFVPPSLPLRRTVPETNKNARRHTIEAIVFVLRPTLLLRGLLPPNTCANKRPTRRGQRSVKSPPCTNFHSARGPHRNQLIWWRANHGIGIPKRNIDRWRSDWTGWR